MSTSTSLDHRPDIGEHKPPPPNCTMVWHITITSWPWPRSTPGLGDGANLVTQHKVAAPDAREAIRQALAEAPFDPEGTEAFDVEATIGWEPNAERVLGDT